NKTCLNRDVLIKSDRMRNPNRKGRYTLLDEGSGVFTVTISGLKKSDSGIYWCGVQRMVKDTYLQVILTVLEGKTCRAYMKIKVTGIEHNSAVIVCPYTEGYEDYPKYFCKGIYKECRNIIKTDGKERWKYEGRFSLADDTDKKKIVVTIPNLSMNDAGQYGCGIEITGPDPFTVVCLTVNKGKSLSFFFFYTTDMPKGLVSHDFWHAPLEAKGCHTDLWDLKSGRNKHAQPRSKARTSLLCVTLYEQHTNHTAVP
ncbi:CMRF35-like molecule 9, partial [Astyanax mexicanus]